MKFKGAFDKFDPKKGDIPEFSTNDFAFIAEVARRILKGRRKREILRGLEAIDFLLGKEEFEFFTEFLPKSTKKKGEFISPTILLSQSMEKGPQLRIKGFPNAKWPEMFAILALAHIGLAFKTPIGAIRLKGIEKENSSRQFTAELAVEGMEAVQFAEKVEQKEEFENQKRERTRKIREQTRKGGETKNKAFRELQDEFNEFYDPESGKSLRQAALWFYRNLPKEKQILRSNTDENIYRFFWRGYKRKEIKN